MRPSLKSAPTVFSPDVGRPNLSSKFERCMVLVFELTVWARDRQTADKRILAKCVMRPARAGPHNMSADSITMLEAYLFYTSERHEW